jgi:thymidine phosphorylase
VDFLNTEIQVNLFQVEFSERYVLVHCLGGVSHGLNLMLVVVVSSVKLALKLASGHTEQKTSVK